MIVPWGDLAVVEGAANGTVVGTLKVQPQFGVPTFALLDNAGGRFSVSEDKIVVANGTALVFASAASHDVVVEATDISGIKTTATLTVEVTEAE